MRRGEGPHTVARRSLRALQEGSSLAEDQRQGCPPGIEGTALGLPAVNPGTRGFSRTKAMQEVPNSSPKVQQLIILMQSK